MLTFLDWDTKKFGYRVFKIDLTNKRTLGIGEILQKARERNAKLIYLYVLPDDKSVNREVKKAGALLADKKITYIYRIPSKYKDYKIDKNIESYLFKKPTKKLLSLSYQAGAFSRFKVDKNFGNNEFETVYKSWLENSLKKKIAMEVLVFKEGNKEVGFVTLGKKSPNADIGLIAVDKAYRGKGIGRKLTEAAINKAVEKGFKKIEVTTQKDNISACRFYEAMEFKVKSLVDVYHLWLNQRMYE